MKYIKKQEYINYCNIIHNNKYDYSLIDLDNLKIKIKCPIHEIFEQNKYSHKKHGCSKCSLLLKSKNQMLGNELFIKKAVEIHGDKYSYVLVEYINNHSKIKIICDKHGIFEQIPMSHLVGNGCSICGHLLGGLKQSHNTEIFIKNSIEIHGDKYSYMLVEYINNNSKVKIICEEHDIFEQLPSNHLTGQGCPKCVGKFFTQNEIILKMKEVHNNLYDYSKSIFTYNSDEILIMCNEHGYFKQKINNHLNLEQGCPKCVGLNKTTEDFVNECLKIHGDLYDYSKTVYILAKEKVIIICKKHGNFKQAPTHHLSGRGCPICKSSKGEKLVNNILTKMEVEFDFHFTFKNFKRYEYDFYLPDFNICIEYDGIQHFQPVKYFGGEEQFEKQIIIDNIKTNYCLDNNIKLIRISYTDFNNIGNILKEEIK